MTIRDREVLEELRDDPELLAIADAVVETQRLRRLKPVGLLAGIAVAAAALFVLVLASPWDRGNTKAPVLDRALAAIETTGPVVHMTFQLEAARDRFSPVVTESYYDKEQKLVRIISRSDGKLLGDYTTHASEDEFVTFPGLLDGADYYREALSSGKARVVGTGTWRGRPVRWVRLVGGGGPGVLEIGIDQESYRPVVFRSLNPDGKPSGFQVAVLGFEYVSPAQAAFEPGAPVLATGTVLGRDCRPIRARVGSFLSTGEEGVSAEIASARTGPDGRFTLRADPAKEPFRSALAASGGWLNFNVMALTRDFSQGHAFSAFSRYVEDGKWWAGTGLERPAPITLTVSRDLTKNC
jgi:hypothetical protein